MIERRVRINYIRDEPLVEVGTSSPSKRAICGFTLELPDEIPSKQTVIDDFVDALQAEPIDHVLKFEDPLLQDELAKTAMPSASRVGPTINEWRNLMKDFTCIFSNGC